jgi:hypothetical protein
MTRRRSRTLVRTCLWLALSLVVMWSCREDVTAPGSCPEFCPTRLVREIDTIFAGSIVNDSAYTGYVPAYGAAWMEVVTGGSVPDSRSLIRYISFADTIEGREILSLDSFQVDLRVRSVSDPSVGLELLIYRLPVTVDTTTTFADTEPWFQDSLLVATIAVPDTIGTDSTVSAVLPLSAFPDFVADSLTVAVGVGMRGVSGGEGYAHLGTRDGGRPSLFSSWLTVVDTVPLVLDSAELDTLDLSQIPADSMVIDTIQVMDARQPDMDTYVFAGWSPPAAEALLVGSAPAWRSLLRVDLPIYVTDSSDISRATLYLVPSEPVPGAPGDTLRLRADALAADIGAKSPLLALPDTSVRGAAGVLVGSTDTVAIEVTHILKSLRVDTLLPASIMLRIIPEGGQSGQLRFWSSRNTAFAPSLHVTFIPLFPRPEPQ